VRMARGLVARENEPMHKSHAPTFVDLALWRACARGDAAGALDALDQGASGWIQDAYGRCALAWAASGERDDLAALCIQAILTRCNPLAFDAFDQTPLMVAASKGNARAVKALLPSSDPLAVDAQGRSAFQVARAHGFDALAMELLGSAISARERAVIQESIAEAGDPGRRSPLRM
jgi:ankyrin repeat protein